MKLRVPGRHDLRIDPARVWRAHQQGVTTADLAARFGCSRRHVITLLARLKAAREPVKN